ncbi:MAG: hypothetical protein GVY20_17815 [Bacteroidetes bacterium]|jgi:hypothetical protein|nr:hypothetical protein [Bacteroidota bacterium]
MRPQQPKLTFSDEEFFPDRAEDAHPKLGTNPSKVAAFTMLFGASKWNELKKQFSTQRITPARMGGITDDELENLSQEEYEAKREQIAKDMELPSKDEPVFGEVNAPDLTVKGIQGQKLFIEAFGAERYFQAMGINPELDSEAYHQIQGREYKPYKTSQEQK